MADTVHHNPPPFGISPFACGLGYRTLRRKIPHVRLVPLNVGYEERRIDYLYSHQGKYLLVPNTPVEICRNCGMVYYDAAVLKKIEHHFFAIHQHAEAPDCYIEMPTKAYS